MLFFTSDEVIYTQYDKAIFDSNITCQEFLFQNKVMLTLELLRDHNQDETMKGFEYFCQERNPIEEVPEGPEV
mgnify:CR=1 FL=1